MIAPSTHFYIVDDDQPFGKSLVRLLSARRMHAEYFRSAKSFLDSVPPGQKGFAIIDINMPEMDGFSLLDKMRAQQYAMPVVLITGLTQSDSRDLALQKGAIGFLQKPFSEESLMDLLEK